jgi:glycosyltransferase involved in cell wall biosynthesis
MEVGSLRSRKFAAYLPRYGWTCEIITAYRGKDVESMFSGSVHIHPTYTCDFLKILRIAATLIRQVITFIKKTYRSLKFNKKKVPQNISISMGGFGIANRIAAWFLLPDAQFLWILLALPKALWVARNCGVIYSSAWPVSAHVLGLIVHKVTKKPWVADYRDPWTLNTNWSPPTRFHRWLGERLDRATVENASFVVNVTERRTQNFKKKYYEQAYKCITIHNGYDSSDVTGFRGRKSNKEYILFTSLGSFYGGRNPIPFIESIKESFEEGFLNRDNLKCLLINAFDPQLQIAIEQLQLSDVVKILPWMPQIKAFEYLAASDVALLFGSDMAKEAMTSKVYEYAGMGKLIFALVPDGPVKDFVIKCNGIVADPKEKVQIKSALKELVGRWQKGEIADINVAAITAVAKFERSALTYQMAELLKKSS